MQQMAYAELEVALSDSRALAATPFVSQHPGVSDRVLPECCWGAVRVPLEYRHTVQLEYRQSTVRES